MSYVVYMLQCRDGSLYTGITNNLDKRLHKHQQGTGAKYVASRLPFKLVYIENQATRSEALKRELKIKKLKRIDKLRLFDTVS